MHTLLFLCHSNWSKISERHITLDRAMYGSDQAASVEVMGFYRLVEYIRTIEIALGDGVKTITPEEVNIKEKLRRVEWKEYTKNF